jgi:hypothetical protein
MKHTIGHSCIHVSHDDEQMEAFRANLIPLLSDADRSIRDLEEKARAAHLVANGSSLLPQVAKISGQIIRDNADQLADMVPTLTRLCMHQLMNQRMH